MLIFLRWSLLLFALSMAPWSLSTALRVAQFVVDCIEGCAVQTVTVLRQILAERVIPNLFVIKVDCCTLNLQMEQ